MFLLYFYAFITQNSFATMIYSLSIIISAKILCNKDQNETKLHSEYGYELLYQE